MTSIRYPSAGSTENPIRPNLFSLADCSEDPPDRMLAAPNSASFHLQVPVFIWTLQFYKTYYSNVFYF
jgi:hypothetical protein